MAAALIFPGLKCMAAALAFAGFTVPAAAEPFSGVAAAIAFLVVFSELISDFFWIVMVFPWLLVIFFDCVLRLVQLHESCQTHAVLQTIG
jgi:hypothetical protein